MSVVIVGGNECMERQYKNICREYRCCGKVFTRMEGLKNKIGQPDLLILFTGTMSHKMLNCALSEVKGQNVRIARSHSSSASALKRILAENT